MAVQFVVFVLSSLVVSISSTSCLLPPVPKHGQVTADTKNLRVNDTVTFKCTEGYTLVGEPTVRCLPDEQWSAEGQQCNGSGIVSGNGTFSVRHPRGQHVRVRRDITSRNVTLGVCGTLVVLVIVVVVSYWGTYRRHQTFTHSGPPLTHFWDRTREQSDRALLTNNYTTVV